MIYIALDGLKLHECFSVFHTCKDLVTGFKIGPETLLKDILERGHLVKDVADQSKLFLDIKLHDIPQTVQNTLLQAKSLNPNIVTVHTAVAQSANIDRTDMKIVGVTSLTSEESDLLEVCHKAEHCKQAGIDGVVCSVHEVKSIKESWPNAICVVPGIRPSWYPLKDDQKRTGTPAAAKLVGADFLVIGRPITRTDNPRKTCQQINEELAAIAS